MAFVLAPLPPIANWLAELDKWSKDSPGYFVDRPIILDLASVMLDTCGIGQLVEALGGRGIRIMGLEGVEADQLGPSLPPLLKGGRPASGSETAALAASDQANGASAAGAPQRPEPSSLLIESPIRSGQSVIFHTAMSPCSARSLRAPKLLPADRFTSTGRCADGPWQVRWATPARASSAARTKPN